jgi:hypothetical protein
MVHAIGRVARSCQDEDGCRRLYGHAELVRAGLSTQFLPEDRRRFDDALAATLPEPASAEAR